MKEYLGFLCERGVYEYPRLGGGHTSETVYRVLNESKECVHTIYVLRGESEKEFEDIVLRHKYNLFAKNINGVCFLPLYAVEYSGYLYEDKKYRREKLGEINLKRGFIFNKDQSLETKEILARNLQPLFEKNREVGDDGLGHHERCQLKREKEMLNRLGWK